jgi:hypothetical protein
LRQRKSIYGILAAVLVVSCTTADDPGATKATQPLPPGDALPNRVDAMLYGSAQSCIRDSECPGQVCYYGSCIGLLIVDQRWMQDSIAAQLSAEIEGHPALRDRVVAHLERVLLRADTDLAFRARAVVPLEMLKAHEPIQAAMKSGNERLEGAAALALTRLGFTKAMPITMALTEHREPAIVCEALRALGMSGHDDALLPLLRTLNPVLGTMLLRSALAGLGNLGDKRAIRPLIDFLEDGPDHMRQAVTRTLRTISGERFGTDPSLWKNWLASSNTPLSPKYALRVSSSEAELGIPTP